MPKVLTNEQVQHFKEKGWVKVEQAYPREEALKVQDFLWNELLERHTVKRDDPSTWTQPVIRLGDYYESVTDGCNTDRLTGAIEDLLGEDRWQLGQTRHKAMWGGFIINFGPEVPGGWHYDGSQFRHYLDSWEQGLLLVCLFSDVRKGGSGTLVAEGSHHIVAKMLEKHPEGLGLGEAIQECNKHPWLAELVAGHKASESKVGASLQEKKEYLSAFTESAYKDPDGYSLRVVETTGGPGDIVICHPFLYHAPSNNELGVPRFMCNRVAPTKERMKLNRENPADYSVVEQMIRSSLGLKDDDECTWARREL
jgi:hypothetical protein